jgi:hypothetical protein
MLLPVGLVVVALRAGVRGLSCQSMVPSGSRGVRKEEDVYLQVEVVHTESYGQIKGRRVEIASPPLRDAYTVI